MSIPVQGPDKPPRVPVKKRPIALKGGRLFPHTLDPLIARMPHDQRFEVIWPRPLGPWGAKGVEGRPQHDVIERHIDLIGANLPRLLELRAIRPTQKPAYKHPVTIANLKRRAAMLPRTIDAAQGASDNLRAQGLNLPPAGIVFPEQPPIIVPSTSTISIPNK